VRLLPHSVGARLERKSKASFSYQGEHKFSALFFLNKLSNA